MIHLWAQVYGYDYADILDGGAGNDYLAGGNENDTYIFGYGYGQDVIYDLPLHIGAPGNDQDRLVFKDVNSTDVVIERNENEDDFVLKIIGTTDQVTLVDQNNITSSPIPFSQIDNIVFADNVTWTAGQPPF